jgi:hypothetical protein
VGEEVEAFISRGGTTKTAFFMKKRGDGLFSQAGTL